MSAKPESTGRQISEEDVRRALERSGYPFELELFNALRREELDPTAGFRLRVASGTGRASRGDDPDPGSSVTREIDLMARVHYGAVVSSGSQVLGAVSLHLLSLIEAKSLPGTSAFVGFTSAQLQSEFDRALLRVTGGFGGAPCHGAIAGYGEASNVAPLLAMTLDPLNAGPLCIQWSTVEQHMRNGKPEYVADHSAKWAAAISHLVRAESIHKYDISRQHLGAIFSSSQRTARIDFIQPVIFVKTPHLYVYEVATHTLTKTPHLMLAQYFELHEGGTTFRVIDVVADGDMAGFANRHRQVKCNFEVSVERHGALLLELAEMQRERFAREMGERLRDEANKRRMIPDE